MTDETGVCRVCGAPIEPTTAVFCVDCATPHHRDCWSYLGGCCTYACGSKRSVDSLDGVREGACVPAFDVRYLPLPDGSSVLLTEPTVILDTQQPDPSLMALAALVRAVALLAPCACVALMPMAGIIGIVYSLEGGSTGGGSAAIVVLIVLLSGWLGSYRLRAYDPPNRTLVLDNEHGELLSMAPELSQTRASRIARISEVEAVTVCGAPPPDDRKGSAHPFNWTYTPTLVLRDGRLVPATGPWLGGRLPPANAAASVLAAHLRVALVPGQAMSTLSLRRSPKDGVLEVARTPWAPSSRLTKVAVALAVLGPFIWLLWHIGP